MIFTDIYIFLKIYIYIYIYIYISIFKKIFQDIILADPPHTRFCYTDPVKKLYSNSNQGSNYLGHVVTEGELQRTLSKRLLRGIIKCNFYHVEYFVSLSNNL